MFEFINTATGWRVYWGPDPLGNSQDGGRQDPQDGSEPEGPEVLPWRHPEYHSADRSAG